MKRSPLRRKTRLSTGSCRLSTTTRLKKSGNTKAKKVKRQRNYYASTVWKAKRKAALERAGHRCEYLMESDAHYSLRRPWALMGLEWDWERTDGMIRCGVTPEQQKLHVHHKTNVRFGGDELPEDLIVYCKEHHDLVEARDFPHRQHR